jgi:phospholipase C
VLPIVRYLDSLGDELKANCDSGHYYMLNNTNPGFLPNGQLDTAGIANGTSIPPSSVRTIGDALNEQGISWAYYGGAYNAAANPMNALDVLIGQAYCKICNFEAYASSIMGNPMQRSGITTDRPAQ